MNPNRPWPEELRLTRDKSALSVKFDSGEEFQLSAEYLRVSSPSADVKGHGRDGPRLVAGKQDVRIKDMQAIGNYAVRLVFDDGHDTGLYSWDYLHELGRDERKLWADYLGRLKKDGASR
jgi:DUF971 family protein